MNHATQLTALVTGGLGLALFLNFSPGREELDTTLRPRASLVQNAPRVQVPESEQRIIREPVASTMGPVLVEEPLAQHGAGELLVHVQDESGTSLEGVEVSWGAEQASYVTQCMSLCTSCAAVTDAGGDVWLGTQDASQAKPLQLTLAKKGYSTEGLAALSLEGAYRVTLRPGQRAIRGTLGGIPVDEHDDVTVSCTRLPDLPGQQVLHTRPNRVGEFEFGDLRAGVYRVQASGATLREAVRVVELERNIDSQVDFRLESGQSFTAQVVSAVDGSPVAGAMVKDHIRKVVADDRGRFRFLSPPDVTSRTLIEVSAGGFATRTFAADHLIEHVTIEMDPAGQYAVVIEMPALAEDANSLSVEFVQVSNGVMRRRAAQVSPLGENGPWLARAGGFDTTGSVVPVAIVKCPFYEIEEVQATRIEADSNEFAECARVTLVRGGTVCGQAVSANGEPLPGTVVSIEAMKGFHLEAGQPGAPITGVADNSGAFIFHSVPFSDGVVTARARGHEGARVTFSATTAGAGVTHVALTMGQKDKCTSRIAGSVGGSIGDVSVEGLPVHLRDGFGQQWTAATDSSGHFSFQGLPSSDVFIWTVVPTSGGGSRVWPPWPKRVRTDGPPIDLELQ